MVLDFYKLREQPFGVTPDPRYLYMGATHREALAALLYGLDAGCGFVALIAEPGLGKTTLLFHVLDSLRDKVTVVLLSQNAHTPVDLLRAILVGLGVDDAGSNLSELQSRLDGFLAEQLCSGKKVVVIIDEAQNLDNSVLESVRMLSNFETPREKLVQIVLCGQPQLAEKIAAPDLVQLKQRVSIFARLEPFSLAETTHYIQHRLGIAGYDPVKRLFDREAEALIAKYSEGVPRNINNLCFNALNLGCAMKKTLIDAEIVLEVAADLDLSRWQRIKAVAARPTHFAVQSGPKCPGTFSSRTKRNAWSTWAPTVVSALFIATGLLAVGQKWLHSKDEVLVTAQTSALSLTAGSRSASTSRVRRDIADAAGSTSTGARDPGPPLVTGLQLSPTTTHGMEIHDYATAVRVLSGRTLLGICIENFGKCDSKRLEELHLLNPRLKDLNHIEVGDRLLIPRVQDISGSANGGPMLKAPGTDGRSSMSRHFELMQEMERTKASQSGERIKALIPGKEYHRANISDSTSGLVQRLFLQQSQTAPRLVVIAGIDHGEGSSRVAASIAEVLAANATRGVCLVQANFRAPALPAIPKPTSAHGLTSALQEEGPIWSFVKPTCNERMWLLATGPLDADSPNLFNSVGMRSRCSELREEFDFVIVDAPPLGRHADAVALAQLSDGIVLVIEAEETRREAAIAVVEDLRSSQIAILGAVLNQRIYPIPEPIYRRL